ncbi:MULTISPECIES: amino acid ABC transporter permease [unclassified Aureimonas]|uniref:amino acid ABC transporter permease n=1 Tax=unclassified Aureimonas TaxID=2615206 RepID=UPI0006F3AD55|nr:MULTISPECIES: amino acid ABC transporter permease [unclassified Aureimonas]KQT53938.1 amino acid ABC transporter [Aureimonas sp. Leaf427]KQT71622.1 amino acid ABC transporter [Aureimonas sp. Leaf460]
MYTFQFRSIYEYIPLLWEAARITLSLSVTAIVLSLALGCILAVMRRSANPFARGISLAYIEVMRNTPLLVILYLVYFGLPATGLRLSSYTAALIGLTLNSAGYMAEIVRSGLVAVAKGQFESARAQGFTPVQLYRHIVMPQVFRTIYISLGNQFISVILASSLASTIAVEDVASWMQTTGSISFRFFETFLIAALVYLVLCQIVNLLRLGVGYWLFADQRARR